MIIHFLYHRRSFLSFYVVIEEFVTYNYAIMNTLKVLEKKKEKGNRFFFSYLILLEFS